MVRWWSEMGTGYRRSRSCFRQIKPENSVGKFSGREAVHLSLDDYHIDVKPFFDTVVQINYSSGFPAVPPGALKIFTPNSRQSPSRPAISKAHFIRVLLSSASAQHCQQSLFGGGGKMGLNLVERFRPGLGRIGGIHRGDTLRSPERFRRRILCLCPAVRLLFLLSF